MTVTVEVIELPGLPHLMVVAREQGSVCVNVMRILSDYTLARGRGYVTCNDSDVNLPSDVPPCLTVEILSPDDRAGRTIDKINDYLHGGVELVWVVDPAASRSRSIGRIGRPPSARMRTCWRIRPCCRSSAARWRNYSGYRAIPQAAVEPASP